MKLSDFGGCKAVLLFPKVNKGAIADVVVTLFEVVLFTMLLKPAMLVTVVIVVVLIGNNVVLGDWDDKLDTTT